MNNKGQMIVFSLLMLVIVVIVFMALIPVFQDSIANARGSDGLNCVTTTTANLCETDATEPCYNSSMDAQTTSCLILDIYLPYIIIVVLIMGVGALVGQKTGMFGGGQMQQPAYSQGY